MADVVTVPRNAGVHVSVALAAVLYGSSFATSSIGAHTFGPIYFGAMRFSAAGVALLVWVCVRSRRAPGLDVVLWSIAAGVVGFGLNQVLFLNGLLLTSASESALIYGLAPLITAVLVQGSEGGMEVHKLVGAGVCLMGIVIAVPVSSVNSGDLVRTVEGDLLVAGSVCAWAVGMVVSRRALAHESPVWVTALMAMSAGAFLWAVAGVWGRGFGSVTEEAMVALGFTTLGPTMLAGTLWSKGVQVIGAWKASMYTYLEPVAGVVVAAMVLGSGFAQRTVVGLALVLGGMVIGLKSWR